MSTFYYKHDSDRSSGNVRYAAVKIHLTQLVYHAIRALRSNIMMLLDDPRNKGNLLYHKSVYACGIIKGTVVYYKSLHSFFISYYFIQTYVTYININLLYIILSETGHFNFLGVVFNNKLTWTNPTSLVEENALKIIFVIRH